MKSWTSFLSRAAAVSFIGIALFQGCVRTKSVAVKDVPLNAFHPPVMVFPLENMTGNPVPARDIRDAIAKKLRSEGVAVAEDGTMEKFLARHRLRYTGGIDIDAARAIREETGAGSVLLTSVGLYSELVPPKVAISARLVSTESLSILWIDSVGLSGDDSPGILGLGLINYPKALVEKATAQLAESLTRHLSGRRSETSGGPKGRRYPPESEFKSMAFGPELKPHVLSFSLPASGGGKGTGTARLEVSLKPPSGNGVTVDYGIRGGTAKGAGEDYRFTGGTLTFEPAETKKTIEIEIAGDARGEEDKTIEIALSDPVNAVLGWCARHTYTIVGSAARRADPFRENRVVPEVTFDRASQAVPENACGVAARMVLSFVTDRDVTVPFEFEVTAGGRQDYTSVTKSPLVIRAGAQSADIVVALADDDRAEEDRKLDLSMGDPVNALPGALRKQTITIKDDDRIRSIAVVPFYNLSPRKNAGEMVGLHFIQHLVEAGGFLVVEPGEIREKLLDLRIIMDDGISLANADDLFKRLDADLILTGRVLDYQDTQGGGGIPVVDFSVLLLERKGKSVVWHSKSRNRGNDGVFLFDRGMVRTSHRLADRMVGTVVGDMLK